VRAPNPLPSPEEIKQYRITRLKYRLGKIDKTDNRYINEYNRLKQELDSLDPPLCIIM